MVTPVHACLSLLFDFMTACFTIILPALMYLGTNSISDDCLSQFVAEVHLPAQVRQLRQGFCTIVTLCIFSLNTIRMMLILVATIALTK